VNVALPYIPGRSSARDWLAMVPMLLGILVGSLTVSAATTALPAMGKDLSLSAAEGIWIIDIYPLALAATLVIAARFGDAFGRKRVMVIGLAAFAALNLIGGFATDGLELIVVRALLGVAEAMVIASVVSTIGSHYQSHERVVAYGLWTATFGAGSAFGPVAGGILAEAPGWRWILFGCVPIAVVAIVLALWLVPESRTLIPPHWDATSIVTSVLALAGIVYALQQVTSNPIEAAVSGVIGLAALIHFVLRQLRLHDPLIDVRLFRESGFTAAYLRIIVGGGTSAATVYLTSIHLQEAHGDSPLTAGLTLLPQAVTIAFGGVLAPFALRWLSSNVLTVSALVLQAIGLAWLAFDPAVFVAPLIFVGIGFGVIGTLAATALFDATTAEQAGQVGAVQEVGFSLGGGLGVAILGTIAVTFTANGFAIALWTAAICVLAVALLPLSKRRTTSR
jgi:DHA2 family multidrug resistance protein-like MFS transporter